MFPVSLGVVMFFLMALSYNLISRRKDAKALNPAPTEALEAASPLQITLEKPKPKLDFEIDDRDSHVSIKRGGPQVSRIEAQIKLRCEKNRTASWPCALFVSRFIAWTQTEERQ
jgi:hypothetical protein